MRVKFFLNILLDELKFFIQTDPEITINFLKDWGQATMNDNTYIPVFHNFTKDVTKSLESAMRKMSRGNSPLFGNSPIANSNSSSTNTGSKI